MVTMVYDELHQVEGLVLVLRAQESQLVLINFDERDLSGPQWVASSGSGIIECTPEVSIDDRTRCSRILDETVVVKMTDDYRV